MRVMSCIGVIIVVFGSAVTPANASDNPVNDLHGGTSVGTTTSTQKGNGPTDVNASKDPKSQGGEPIDTVTGQFLYQYEDLLIQGVIPISVTRLYRSGSRYQGMFGLGWNLRYNERLMLMANGNVLLRSGNSDRNEFTPQGRNTFASPAGSYLTLTQNGDGSFTLRNKYGLIKVYNKEGCLTEYRDRNGNQILFSYDPGGRLPINAITEYAQATNAILVAREYRLTRMETAHSGQLSGRYVTFSYNNNGRVTTVADFTGRRWTYTYDSAGYGELLSVTAPPASDNAQPDVLKYTYTQDHRLTTVADPGEKPTITNRYDTEGKVTGQQWGGVSYGFSYPSAAQRIETNSAGLVVERTLDDKGQILAMKYRSREPAKGERVTHETKYQYDASGQQSGASHSGSPRQYSTLYDKSGNITGIRTTPQSESGKASAVSGDCQVTYEPQFNMPKTITGRHGNVLTCTYDYENPSSRSTNGNLMGILFPAGSSKSTSLALTYNSRGQIASVKTGDGCSTQIGYDNPSGQYTSVVMAAGTPSAIIYSFERDKCGNTRLLTDPMGNTSHYEYDARGRLIRDTDPLGSVVEYVYAGERIREVRRSAYGRNEDLQKRLYSYDERGLLTGIKDHSNAVQNLEYDAAANITRITDALQNCIANEYDERGLLTRFSDAYSNTCEFTYSRDGDLIAMKDANGNMVKASYDATGRFTGNQFPDGTSETISYDAAHHPTNLVARDGGRIALTWDAWGRLSTKSSAKGSVCQYLYDISGRLIQANESSRTTTYGYDVLGRMITENNAFGGDVKYMYNQNGLPTTVTYSDGTVLTYVYDAGNRPTSVSLAGQLIASFEYDGFNRLVGMKYANGLNVTQSYDSQNYPKAQTWTGISAGSLYEENLSCDKAGNIIGKKQSGQLGKGSHIYAYDKAYRLVGETYPAGYPFPNETIAYDAMGNRTAINRSGTVDYTINALNQYTKVGGIVFLYDKNGNLISDGHNQYAFNVENLLLGIQTAAGASISNTYDPLGRRIEEKAGARVTRFVHAGPHIFADVDETGKTLRTYIYGPGIDNLVAMIVGPSSTIYYYVKDYLGSVVALTDSQGAVVESYVYDAWGNVKSYDRDGKAMSESTVGNRFLFQGREYCWGVGIYYFRNRWYAPTVGKWLSVDPIGSSGDANQYTFAGNNPVAFRDPFGTYEGAVWTDCRDCHPRNDSTPKLLSNEDFAALKRDIEMFKANRLRLIRMFGSWKRGENYETYGLTTMATPFGYVSNQVKCYSTSTKEVIHDIESNAFITLGSFAKLAFLGSAGIYSFGLYNLWYDTTTVEQVWLSSIIVENERNELVISMLMNIYEQQLTQRARLQQWLDTGR